MATTTPLLLAILWLAQASAPAPSEPAAGAGLDALLARLARPVPAETAYVERRESSLLSEPLLLRGQLSHPRPGALVRSVESPYQETTTIEEQQVEILRSGERPRRFSLRHAPELEGLLASFQALLGGDRALLEQHYRTALEHGAGGWTLTLTPRDPRLSRRVAAVRLAGRGDELRCMVLHETDGDRSRMLLGPAAANAHGLAAEALDAAFETACSGAAAVPGQHG